MAAALAPLGPLPIVVSPLRRTRETAAALERLWATTAVVDDRVAEIPSPTDDLPSARRLAARRDGRHVGRPRAGLRGLA